MSENASTTIVHHYVENTSNLYFIIMACCVALMITIVLILLIILSISLYALIRFKKCFHSRLQSPRESLKTQEDCLSHDIAEESPTNVMHNNTPALTEQDFGTEINSNIQSIPLSTFKGPEARLDDSSGSSAGLYDVLFPIHQEGEIIYKPPTKLAAFDQRVFASTKKNTKVDSNLGPSFSGLNVDGASGSLEWDYFQPSSRGGSAASWEETEYDHNQIVDVCWV